MTTDIVFGDNWYLLNTLLAASNKAVTMEPPSQDGWLNIVTDMYDMEALTHRMRA